MSKKQLAVVTGATSGIGAALAHALAARGMDLIVIARRAERLDAMKAHLDGLGGITVRTFCADLTDDDALRRVESALRGETVDLLVNSAGFGTYADFAGIDAERIKNELMLDLVVPVALTRAVLPAMQKARRGVILNVSSMAGFMPIPRHATYCAAKAGLTRFTEALHGELRGSGVRVQALCPGPVPTEFFAISGYKVEDVPGPMLQSVDACVSAAMRALDSSKIVYVPDPVIRVFVAAMRFVPLRLKAMVLGGGPAWWNGKKDDLGSARGEASETV